MQFIQQSKKNSVEFFGGIYGEWIDQLPAMLDEKIVATKNVGQRNRYMDAREAIVPKLESLHSRYQRALTQSFDNFAAGYEAEEDEAYDAAGLALVDKAKYEDDVAVRTMATKCGALNAEELWKLNRRFAVARGGKKCLDEMNPCGPQQLCDAMRESLRKLDIDAQVKLMLYRQYDQQVLVQAGAFYKTLNRELAEQGVLRNLSFSAASAAPRQVVGGAPQVVASADNAIESASAAPSPERTAAGKGKTGAANDAAHPENAAPNEAETSLVPVVSAEMERKQTRVIEAIKAVQHKRRKSDRQRSRTMGGANYGALCANGVAGEADTFTPIDLAAALRTLQVAMQLPMSRQAPPRAIAETEGLLIGELGALAEGQERQKVDAVDADTIDLVGMLFEYMLDDPQLPDGLKSLLSHLHTPYLKVALLDQAFFASARHPARILLDLLAAAGARWLQEGDDDDKVYQRIRLVVERIIKEFDDDIAFFDELLKDFTSFVKLLERRADLAAQRTVEAERGLDQLSQAKGLVEQQVSQRIGGTALPGPVMELLEQPWTDFLVFNYLRHGDKSDVWLSSLQVVERVVACTQPLQMDSDSAELEKQYSELNDRVQQGFDSLGYDRDDGERMLLALREIQRQALKGLAPKLDDTKFSRRADKPRSAIARQIKQQRCEAKPEAASEAQRLSPQEKALAEKLSSVSFGTWFEFKQGVNGPSRRLKLSWYSSVSGNYMFVNHSGVKSEVKSLHQLLRSMNDGSVVMLDRENRNFFERAVSSVLGRLNKA